MKSADIEVLRERLLHGYYAEARLFREDLISLFGVDDHKQETPIWIEILSCLLSRNAVYYDSDFLSNMAPALVGHDSNKKVTNEEQIFSEIN